MIEIALGTVKAVSCPKCETFTCDPHSNIKVDIIHNPIMVEDLNGY